MKKIILIPDSFKGTMSSIEICEIMEKQIRKYQPKAEVVSIPVADGGEGTVDSFLAVKRGKKVSVTVKDPFMQDMEAAYGLTDDGTAIIEMAVCAGLPLVNGRADPLKATTFGVGQLIRHAATHGCRKIVVGLGGSCTNDAGAGAAAATGIEFLDSNGTSFVPTGETLGQIAHIDMSGLCPEVANAEIIGMCDVDNPLCGPTGAAYVFARQKGGTDETIPLLDRGLAAFAQAVRAELGRDVSEISGAGAAGGMGGGMAVFWRAQLQSGIDAILELADFDVLANDADMILSGEGRIDSQSLRGKVVIGVARHAKRLGIPLVAIVGDVGDPIEPVYDMGVSGVFSINRVAVDFEQASRRSKQDLALTVDNLFRFLQAFPIGSRTEPAADL